MMVRSIALTLLMASDVALKAASAWSSLWLPHPDPPTECRGGEPCFEHGGDSKWDRGASSRPGPEPDDSGQSEEGFWDRWLAWWSWDSFQVEASWILQLSSRVLVDAARASLEACGTLCASIGFAARWSYWLATAAVGVFLFQLTLWTLNWVILPVAKHALALWRYVRGHGQWHEVAQLQGIRVFRPQWVGPAGREEWTAAYVQQEVRGRGDPREPHDLLVTDGIAIARIRHGTLRGRTNRFGFKLEGERVFSASHRYYRNQVEALDCRIHTSRVVSPTIACTWRPLPSSPAPESSTFKKLPGGGRSLGAPRRPGSLATRACGPVRSPGTASGWGASASSAAVAVAGPDPAGDSLEPGSRSNRPATTTPRPSPKGRQTNSARRTPWRTPTRGRPSPSRWRHARTQRGAPRCASSNPTPSSAVRTTLRG